MKEKNEDKKQNESRHQHQQADHRHEHSYGKTIKLDFYTPGGHSHGNMDTDGYGRARPSQDDDYGIFGNGWYGINFRKKGFSTPSQGRHQITESNTGCISFQRYHYCMISYITKNL